MLDHKKLQWKKSIHEFKFGYFLLSHPIIILYLQLLMMTQARAARYSKTTTMIQRGMLKCFSEIFLSISVQLQIRQKKSSVELLLLKYARIVEIFNIVSVYCLGIDRMKRFPVKVRAFVTKWQILLFFAKTTFYDTFVFFLGRQIVPVTFSICQLLFGLNGLTSHFNLKGWHFGSKIKSF